MKPTKTTGRIIGLLFLATAIPGATGTFLRGLTGAEANTIAFLNSVVENTGQMKLAIYLDLLASAIVVALAIYLLPLIKRYSIRWASTYVAIACINFVVITVSNVIHIGLLAISAEYNTTSLSDPQHFTILSKVVYEAYYWVHFLMLLLYSIGGAVLFYFLFKTRIVSSWLAVWGLLASAIVFIGGALQLAEVPVSFLFFMQNGIFMLVFIAYLLIKGFREIEIQEIA